MSINSRLPPASTYCWHQRGTSTLIMPNARRTMQTSGSRTKGIMTTLDERSMKKLSGQLWHSSYGTTMSAPAKQATREVEDENFVPRSTTLSSTREPVRPLLNKYARPKSFGSFLPGLAFPYTTEQDEQEDLVHQSIVYEDGGVKEIVCRKLPGGAIPLGSTSWWSPITNTWAACTAKVLSFCSGFSPRLQHLQHYGVHNLNGELRGASRKYITQSITSFGSERLGEYQATEANDYRSAVSYNAITTEVPDSETKDTDEIEQLALPVQTFMEYRIPDSQLQEAMLASRSTGAAYWQYSRYQNHDGQKVKVHYCRSKETTERIAQMFLDKEVLGFDIEWKPGSITSDGIKKNVSLIQLASEERIALFHVALYSKGNDVDALLAPTLKKIMEDPNITKVGVAVKSDCTRLRKFMGIEARGLFELSHLYKLVKFSCGDITKINKVLVSLAKQVEEHLQLPLFKGEVRSSDWSQVLNYQQIQYAASDSYAGLRLYDILEGKRKALDPVPPRPEHAELNLPILLTDGKSVATSDESEELLIESEPEGTNQTLDNEQLAQDVSDVAIEENEDVVDVVKKGRKAMGAEANKEDDTKNMKPALCPEIAMAEDWVSKFRATLPADYKVKAAPSNLRAYSIWHHQEKDVADTARLLRDPPLALSTVSNYILAAIKLEKLPHRTERLADVFEHIPDSITQYRYGSLKKW